MFAILFLLVFLVFDGRNAAEQDASAERMREMERYQKVREEICEVCNLLYDRGYVVSNDGNVSVRVEPDKVLITPSGVGKGRMEPDMLVLCDLEGNILDGDRYPSSESKMHLMLYRERSDVMSVVHAHPPTATGYAVANKPLDEYSMIETVIAIGSIPVTPYGTPSTYEVPDAIAPYLKEHDVLLLQNHGALTVGCDLITAYYRMETLELYAKISLTAHLLGGAQEIPRPQIDKLLDLRENYYHITGKHPGYKKYTKEER